VPLGKARDSANVKCLDVTPLGSGELHILFPVEDRKETFTDEKE